MSSTPTFGDVIKRVIEKHTDGLRVSMPARVESYDVAEQTVNVQPLIKEYYYDEEGVRRTERLPVITRVPVVFMGSGNFRVTFPIEPGDTVLLVFADSSLDIWLGVGGEVDPREDRHHNLSDAVAIPGLFSPSSPLAGAQTDRMRIGQDEGGAHIEITDSLVNVGDDPQALSTETHHDAINDFVNAIADEVITLLGGPMGGGAGLTADKLAFAAAIVSGSLTTVLKGT